MKNTYSNNKKVADSIHNIARWHHARNLVDGATDQTQYVKLIEEAGELAGNISRGKCIKDDIGDMIVVLINIAERNGLTISECLDTAYDDIKDRCGIMYHGNFIKESDDAYEDAVRELQNNRTGRGDKP